jgi:hypothetical protein
MPVLSPHVGGILLSGRAGCLVLDGLGSDGDRYIGLAAPQVLQTLKGIALAAGQQLIIGMARLITIHATPDAAAEQRQAR